MLDFVEKRIAIGRHVVPRRVQSTPRHLRGERRVRLDLEAIRGEVRHAPRQDFLHAARNSLGRLARHGHDEIGGDSLETGAPRPVDRVECLHRRVDSPQRLQHPPFERLNADAQTVYPSLEEKGQFLVGEALRVRFDRPLAHPAEVERSAHPREESPERYRVERRRRSTSHVDRAGAAPRPLTGLSAVDALRAGVRAVHGPRGREFPLQRVEESRRLRVVERSGREGAVRADASTVGEVEVETEVHDARGAPPVNGPGGAGARGVGAGDRRPTTNRGSWPAPSRGSAGARPRSGCRGCCRGCPPS